MTSKIIFGASLAFALFAGTMFTATNVFADDISDIRGPLADIWTAIERLTNQVQNLESQVNTFDTYMLGATYPVDDGSSIILTLDCEKGDTLLSGGYDIFVGNTNDPIHASYPSPSGWKVDVNNISGEDMVVDLYIICHDTRS